MRLRRWLVDGRWYIFWRMEDGDNQDWTVLDAQDLRHVKDSSPESGVNRLKAGEGSANKVVPVSEDPAPVDPPAEDPLPDTEPLLPAALADPPSPDPPVSRGSRRRSR